MRNVVVCGLKECSLPFPAHSLLHRSGTDVYYAATSSAILFVDSGKVVDEVVWPSEVTSSTYFSVTNFELLDDSEIYAVFPSHIVIVDVETKETSTWEVSSICGEDTELEAASWQPGHSLLAICSSSKVWLLDRLLQPISMKSFLSDEEEPLEQLVTVGWGSALTQFQGAAGKAARERKEDKGCVIGEEDSGRTAVEWRADGSFFLTSFVNPQSQQRLVWAWNSSGQLISRLRTEDCTVGESIGVKPRGNLIAISQLHQQSTGIFMYERNGEKRSPGPDCVCARGALRSLSWDSAGVLLGCCVSMEEGDSILVWSLSNNEWNCKLCLPFPEGISSWKWHPEEGGVIIISLRDCRFLVISLCLQYTSIASTVLSVSSGKLRLTDLARNVLPPPMANAYLDLEQSSPLALSLSPTSLTVVTSQLKLLKYRRDGPVWAKEGDSVELRGLARPWFLISIVDSSLGLLALLRCGESSQVFVVSTDGSCQRILHSEQRFVWMGSSGDSEVILLLNEEGSLWLLSPLLTLSPLHTFSSFSLPFHALLHKEMLFLLWREQLSSYSIARREERVLAAHGVTSFFVENGLLFFVLHANKLFILDAETLIEKQSSRSVETGACVVGVRQSQVVLQMPRGNLETISCRCLLQQRIECLLKEKRVGDALVVMRRERLDMTLLLERPELLESAAEWLPAVNDPDLLTLAISSLRASPKLPAFCSSLRNSLNGLPPSHLLRLFPVLLSCILTPFPSHLNQALLLIQQQIILVPESARDRTLRHWIHFVGFHFSGEEIFRASLSTYSLPFSVLVAEILSMDPKEYLPILNEFNKVLPEEFRRFRIDVFRGDLVSALRHLSLLPDKIDEALDLVEKNSLHSHALSIYSQTSQFKKVAATCSIWAMRRGEWEEAERLARLAGKEEERRVEEGSGLPGSLLCASQWKGTHPPSGQALLSSLHKNGRRSELIFAARLQKGGWHERMEALASVSAWRELIDDISEEKERKEAEEEARNILRGRAEALSEQVAQLHDQLNRHSSRLLVVRKAKEEELAKIAAGELSAVFLEGGDAFSEASTRSTASRSRLSSSASTTTRRTKQIARKKASLKEGGSFEDSALLIALQEIYKTLVSICYECEDLLPALLSASLVEEGRSLQRSVTELEETALQKLPWIWPARLLPHLLPGPLTHIYDEGGIFCPPQGIVTMPRSVLIEAEMIAPAMPTRSWKLQSFC